MRAQSSGEKRRSTAIHSKATRSFSGIGEFLLPFATDWLMIEVHDCREESYVF
jgi:hypothetical protein